VVEWVAGALRESHTQRKSERDQSIDRPQHESNRIQGRLDAIYLDKLDGSIESACGRLVLEAASGRGIATG
jgi:site-specific DNA recombinase